MGQNELRRWPITRTVSEWAPGSEMGTVVWFRGTATISARPISLDSLYRAIITEVECHSSAAVRPLTSHSGYSRLLEFTGWEPELLHTNSPVTPASLLVEVQWIWHFLTMQMMLTPWPVGQLLISKTLNSGHFYHKLTNWAWRLEFRGNDYLIYSIVEHLFSTYQISGQWSGHEGLNRK